MLPEILSQMSYAQLLDYLIELDRMPDPEQVHAENGPIVRSCSPGPNNNGNQQAQQVPQNPCDDPVRRRVVFNLLSKLFHDNDALRLVGMPAAHKQAFEDAARQTDCVISSREIGFHCTGLVTDGYDTKGFRIKSKSCDFGPMAGFLLENPLYNKKGADYYFDQKKDVHKALDDADNIGASTHAGTPWRAGLGQICVTAARIQWLHENAALLKMSMRYQPRTGCYTGDFTPPQSFRVIYIFRPEIRDGDEVWALYELGAAERKIMMDEQEKTHDEEEMLEEDHFPMRRLFGDDPEEMERDRVVHTVKKVTELEEHADRGALVYERDETNLGLFEAGRLSWQELAATPLMGLTNPDPAYKNGHYKNCVTGDYDLFAVWPRIEDYDPDGEDRRMSPARPDHRENNARIIRNEHKQLGNLSDRVSLTAGIINSLLPAEPGARGKSREMVHHSDEAGRPYVNSIELPVIAFIPHCGQVYTVGMKDLEQMRYFFVLCDFIGFVPLQNLGWVRELGDG